MAPERDIGFQIRALSNLMRRYIEREKQEAGIESIRGVHGWAIDYFYRNRDNDIFQKDFEERFLIRRSTASNMLKLMEKKGLIERRSVDYDARLKKIVLTEKAAETHKRILDRIAEREKQLRRGLSDSEVEFFLKILDKIKANLEDSND